ncbi:MAG: SsrA-binding protein SmpB [Verrucomicrobiota bacterium]|jgi:SsrA-binding protein|nr:SsrA-binding protein SmpB [Verrucomicrobiota bacterium]MEC8906041.1 SsrA-binding protein SmpB [Verrucomicrobiota bacterium]MEC9327025.1 SsrA-binding protein SmpB [Verrucomicrobiota bacterium]MED6299917.1 SsrA-binding protein SmpB [Verrucomicrobiota bacterium]NRB45744.1 SsrA-binding protein SmpB [Verrucomicrobiales bacterium]
MSQEISKNRKAFHDFNIVDKFEAGIELKGTEVKSIREGHVHLRDAFAVVQNGQIFLVGCDIKPYQSASHEQHEPRRPRRLLLHRREINRIEIKLGEKGFSMPALRLYWKEKRVKVELGLGRGKAQYDKRDTLKKKDQDREAKREVARFNRS